MMSIRETHTVNFGSRTSSAELIPSGGDDFTLYGYNSDQTEIPIEYLVRISSRRHKCTVVGVLQEPITTHVESTWRPIVSPDKLSTGSYWTQMVTGGKKSLITKATTRRMWEMTSPMALNLKLQFEAITNAETDVMAPLRLLQSMACPKEPAEFRSGSWDDQGKVRGLVNLVKALPILSPPGPTPFSTGGILQTKSSPSYSNLTDDNMVGGDLIMVEIGRLLTFWNVVVTDVSATHANKPTKDGNCISGTVDFTFETYEMITTDALNHAYTTRGVSSTTEETKGEG